MRLGEQLSRQLASHAKAFHEDMARQFAAFDAKYKDLPGCMKRVENLLDGEHKDLPERVTRLAAAVQVRKRR